MAFDGSTLDSAEPGIVGLADAFSLSGNDVDIVAVELVRGHLYAFDVDGNTRSYLRLFDPLGNRDARNTDGFLDSDQLKANDNGTAPGESRGSDPYTRYVAQYTGVHYVAVSPDYLRDYSPITLADRPTPINPLPPTSGTLTVTDLGPAALFASGPIAPLGLGDISPILRDTDGRGRVAFTASAGAEGNVLSVAGERDSVRVALGGADLLVVEVNSALGDTRVELTTLGGRLLAASDAPAPGRDAEGIFGVNGTFLLTVTSLTTASGAYEVVVHRNPTFVGTSAVDDLVDGTPINDYYVGLSGNDTLIGLDGNDTLSGGDGDDFLSGGENEDELFGDAGDDYLEGRAEDDFLFGGDGDDRLLGSDGYDSLEGDAGNDTLVGGKQNDTLDGGAGADSLIGSEGLDRLVGGTGADTLEGGSGDDTLAGDAGDDVLAASLGRDLLDGGDGNDRLAGEEGRDQMTGGGGADSLFGGLDADRLNGGDGADLLDGGTEADTIEGGFGADTLIGGGGLGVRDVFVFRQVAEGGDRIVDFAPGEDVIDLGRSLANTATPGNLTNFVAVADDGAGGALLSVDADGVAGPQGFTLLALVEGVSPTALLDAANFIL